MEARHGQVNDFLVCHWTTYLAGSFCLSMMGLRLGCAHIYERHDEIFNHERRGKPLWCI